MAHRSGSLGALLLPATLAWLAGACAPTGERAMPASRLVEGTVRDEVTGRPIAGAFLFVPDRTESTTSDESGRFTLAVPAGPVAIALHAPGYLDEVEHDVRGASVALVVLPAHPGTAAELALRPQRAPRPIDLSGDLTPIARAVLALIASGAPAPTLAEALALVPPSSGEIPPGIGSSSYALSAEPATIRVWRRALDGSTSSCSGRVDVIPFEAYVKGVVPHEWIASWAQESLRAGADCARTYAWYWIAAGGKYSCADIDDTTASQVYMDSTYPSTDDAVTATTGEAVVTSSGSLAFAEYSAENGDPTADGVDEPYCAGYAVAGHGHGTCQWGTERWASMAGKDHVWMMAHYYPGDAIATPPPPVPAYAASYGSESYPSTMTSGDVATVSVSYKNDGTATWDTTNTRLGTTAPRDRPSAFYDPSSWLGPNRPAAVDAATAPGAAGRFSFTLIAPAVASPTTYVEHWGIVQEGSGWFGPADSDVWFQITVLPRPLEGTSGPSPAVSGPVASGESGAGGAAAPAMLSSGCSIVSPGQRRPLGPGILVALVVLAIAVRSGRVRHLLRRPSASRRRQFPTGF